MIDKIVDHSYRNEKLVLKMEWHRYTMENETWKKKFRERNFTWILKVAYCLKPFGS